MHITTINEKRGYEFEIKQGRVSRRRKGRNKLIIISKIKFFNKKLNKTIKQKPIGYGESCLQSKHLGERRRKKKTDLRPASTT